jgi:cellulose synthase operon protein YhjQ
MGPDVRHLLQFLRVPSFRYRDWSWFTSPRQPADVQERAFTSVAVVSLLPRVGRTTLCANLAAALARRGFRAVAVDLDPKTTLGSSLSKRTEIREIGFDANDPDAGLVHWVGQDVGFVPFGPQLASFVQTLPAECDVAFLDVGAGSGPTLQQALFAADEVLVVLRPDAENVDALRPTEALLEQHRVRASARYVINGFDARRAADRDTVSRLRELLGARLLDPPVQEDRAAREALGLGRFLDEQAPASQTAHDVVEISRQVIAAQTPPPRDHPRRPTVRPEKPPGKNVRSR